MLLTGATGVGKSSTLNAIFGRDRAAVGHGADPCTQMINRYSANEWFRIHDTPGLGDGIAANREHSLKLTNTLLETVGAGDGQTYHLIDLALVIIDGGSRDLGTAYDLISRVILPGIEAERVLVVINQADMAMKGRGWDHQHQRPSPELKQFLDEKARSTQRRIHEGPGKRIPLPVCFSAACHYNIDGLIAFIVENFPRTRRYLS